MMDVLSLYLFVYRTVWSASSYWASSLCWAFSGQGDVTVNPRTALPHGAEFLRRGCRCKEMSRYLQGASYSDAIVL